LPPVALALLKSALSQGVDDLAAAMRTEVEFQAVAMGTQDHAEAVRAFLEKRTPEFEGR
jgi:2-(1,2-epoxy-1,2-dihydrophenyl)acetyl-CoA isomerase